MSFGPGEPIGKSNMEQFENGEISGNAHWPLTGNVNTWEFDITNDQLATGLSTISTLQANPPKYTPSYQCTPASLSLASGVGVQLPTGVGPVVARAWGFTVYSGRVANPYHLMQDMTRVFGSPTVVPSSAFPKP